MYTIEDVIESMGLSPFELIAKDAVDFALTNIKTVGRFVVRGYGQTTYDRVCFIRELANYSDLLGCFIAAPPNCYLKTNRSDLVKLTGLKHDARRVLGYETLLKLCDTDFSTKSSMRRELVACHGVQSCLIYRDHSIRTTI